MATILATEADVHYGLVRKTLKFTPYGETTVIIDDVSEIDVSDDVEIEKILTADALRPRAAIPVGRENTITITGRSLEQLAKFELEAIGVLEWTLYGKGGAVRRNPTFLVNTAKVTKDALGGSAAREVSEYEVQIEVIEPDDPAIKAFEYFEGAKPIAVFGLDDDCGLDITTGTTGTFSVALKNAIDANVTINVARSAGSSTIDVATGDETLTFTSADWQTAQDVTIELTGESVGDMAEITITDSGTDYQVQTVVITVVAAGF